ncbi:MAG: exosortase-associated protein EpsI, V-type [Thermaurantiacus sp.]
MLRRRDALLGSLLLASAGGAFALEPRNQLILRGDKLFEDLIPLEFGGWEVMPSNAMILPREDENSLAAMLYSETVSRLYTSRTRMPVMLVIAYGDTQSDRLQLHRPEVCYTAIGFQVGGSRKVLVDMPGGAPVPMRALVARNSQRIEPILYWTRIGDFLPTNSHEQRNAKIRTALQGYVSDGVLVRMSTVAEPTPDVFAELEEFALEMITASDPLIWPALVGRPVAETMKAATAET